LTLEANSEDNILSELEDYEQLADWSKPYVETVFAQGILNGYVEPGGRFLRFEYGYAVTPLI